jgi:Bacterial SH3 domain
MQEDGRDTASIQQEYSDLDREIEKDIRRLKRSTNLLTLLGTIVVILLAVVIGFKIYLDFLNEKIADYSRFKDYVFVRSDEALVYAEPRNNSEIVARLTKGEALFLLNEQDEWIQVEKRTFSGWIQNFDVARKDAWPPPSEGEGVPIRFIDVNWVVDEIDNFTIVGKIENMSDRPLKNIKIQVDFYDREEICCDKHGNTHRPVMSESSWEAREKPLVAGIEEKFVIIGKYDKQFKKIKYRIVSFE